MNALPGTPFTVNVQPGCYTNAELTAAIERTVATLREDQTHSDPASIIDVDLGNTRKHLAVLREEELRRAIGP
jgi:hypothetical protein